MAVASAAISMYTLLLLLLLLGFRDSLKGQKGL
jgi:hypothetical protein